MFLINMYSSFQNIVHTVRQMQCALERILSDLLTRLSDLFIEMSMELYNRDTPVAQPVVMT